MQVEKTKLEGVLLIRPEIFEDFRGKYVETYNYEEYQKNGIDIDFKQDDISISSSHVLRGIHGDNETWKLISCHLGSFYLMVINNDPSSPQYRNWQGFTLSEYNHHQVLVPPKFGNGHLVMSDRALFHYKQSTYYNPAGQFTIIWNDPQYSMWWPIKEPILSCRDESGKFVK